MGEGCSYKEDSDIGPEVRELCTEGTNIYIEREREKKGTDQNGSL